MRVAAPAPLRRLVVRIGVEGVLCSSRSDGTFSGRRAGHGRRVVLTGQPVSRLTSHMLIVGLVNQKGGVGKTSTTVNVAAAAAAQQRSVLVVDMDPQANATAALGVGDDDFELAIDDVLAAPDDGAALAAVIPAARPAWAGVSLVPSRLALAKAEGDKRLGNEFRLRRALSHPQLAADFDLVLIDCPPSVSDLTINALVAATHALIISEPSAPATAGTAALVESVEAVRRYYNPDLTIAGVLMNRMPATREAAFRYQELVEGQDELGVAVWTEHTIPVRAVVPEALGAQVPVGALAGTRGREVADQYAAIAARLLALDTVTLPGGEPTRVGGVA